MSVFGFIMVDYWYYVFAVPGLLLGLYAQMKLTSTYNRYVRVPVGSGATGAEAAREILDRAGLSNMPVNEVGGHLTDHYDPIKRALFLSSENYRGRSLAAVGVAAHEAGHALQHKAAYAPLHARMLLVPATKFASFGWIALIVLGMIFAGPLGSRFIDIAIGLFAVTTLFHLVTLPVEFDASRRAKDQLLKLGIIQPMESAGVSRVLNGAAMTYVAALVTSVFELLYWVHVARSRDHD